MPRISVTTLAALLLAALSLSGCSTVEKFEMQERVAADIQEGDRNLNLDNPSKAHAWFDRAVALRPDDVATYKGLDENGLTYPGLVETLTSHNQWSDIAKYLSGATKYPKVAADPQIWLDLGMAYDSYGDHPSARSAYQNALNTILGPKIVAGSVLNAIKPEDKLYSKAQAEWGADDHVHGREDYIKMIRRYPNSAPVAENALAYSEADANTNLEEAYGYAKTAVASVRSDSDKDDESVGECLDTLGWVEYRMHKDHDAAADMAEALSHIPAEAVSHYHMAVIYQDMGLKREAQIEIRHAVVLDPEDPKIQALRKTLGPPPPPDDAEA